MKFSLKTRKNKIIAGGICLAAVAGIILLFPHEQTIYVRHQNLNKTYSKAKKVYTEEKHLFQTMVYTTSETDYQPLTVRYTVYGKNKITLKNPRLAVDLKIRGKHYVDLYINGKLVKKHIKNYTTQILSGSHIKLFGYDSEPVDGIIRGDSTLIETAKKGDSVTIVQGAGKISSYENAVEVPVVIHSKKKFTIYVNGKAEAENVTSFNEKIKQGSGIQISGADIDTVFGTIGDKKLNITLSKSGEPIFIDEGDKGNSSKVHKLSVSGNEKVDVYVNGKLKGKDVKYAYGSVETNDVVTVKGKNTKTVSVKVKKKDVSIVTAPNGKSNVVTWYNQNESSTASSGTSGSSNSGFKSGKGRNGSGTGSSSSFTSGSGNSGSSSGESSKFRSENGSSGSSSGEKNTFTTGNGKYAGNKGSDSVFTTDNGSAGSKKGTLSDFMSETGRYAAGSGSDSSFTSGNGKKGSGKGSDSSFTTENGKTKFKSSAESAFTSGTNNSKFKSSNMSSFTTDSGSYKSFGEKNEKSQSGTSKSKTSGTNSRSVFNTGSGTYADYGNDGSVFTSGKNSFKKGNETQSNYQSGTSKNSGSSLIDDTVAYQYIDYSRRTSHAKGGKFMVETGAPDGYIVSGVSYNGRTYERTHLFTQEASPMNFTVKLTPITYSIDYINGFNNPNTLTYTIRSGVTLRNPTRPGYTFKGWYKEGRKVTSVNGTGNVTLTAEWQKN